jgi:hypothetical protein
MKKINILWIIAIIVSLVLLPNVSAANCVNLPNPFDPYDMQTWWSDIGSCTSYSSGTPFICTLNTSSVTCGPGYWASPNWDYSMGCVCSCERSPCCGDGVTNTYLGEQCDNGTAYQLNNMVPPYLSEVPKNVWVNMSLNNDTLECDATCQIVEIVQTPYCGDGNIDLSLNEQCDNGTALNGIECIPSYNTSCTYCSSEVCAIATVIGGFCGDGTCENDPDENIGNCFADCGSGNIPGWHTNNDGWLVNEEKRLVGTTSSGNAIDIYSDPFEVKLGKNYTLMATINSACLGVVVDLNDGKCLSRNGWIENFCFTDHELLGVGGQTNFVINQLNINDASQGYFKNVSVRIHVPAGCAEAVFDNISFKEFSPINAQQPLQPSIDLTNACCPSDYCWDGSQCVMSGPWNISNQSNLWSNLTINNYYNHHVNTSLQWLSRGYRCILNETGHADWAPAQVKYDWNFKESGYCMRDSDCFVAHPDKYVNLDNGGSSCIQNGQFITNDSYTTFRINTGNHYCKDGEWTTKTFLIANLLENISSGKPYVLFCDDSGKIFNDIGIYGDSQTAQSVEGGCVLISKEGSEERIITGLYINEPYMDSSGDTFLCAVYNTMLQSAGGDPTMSGCPSPQTMPGFYAGCTPSSTNPEFIRCVRNRNILGNIDLTLYVNNYSYYYLISNKPIDEIDNTVFQRVWNSIVGFFQRLFGYTPDQPLGLANRTNNYERAYLLKNNTLTVYGVEEQKYDEDLETVMTFMYLNMTGPGIPTNNNFNIEYVNLSMNGVYKEYSNTSESQVLIIKYGNSAQIWTYLTAMLRDR